MRRRSETGRATKVMMYSISVGWRTIHQLPLPDLWGEWVHCEPRARRENEQGQRTEPDELDAESSTEEC